MPQPQNFSCQICGESFNSRDQLLNHTRSQHQHKAKSDDDDRQSSPRRFADDELNEGGPL